MSLIQLTDIQRRRELGYDARIIGLFFRSPIRVEGTLSDGLGGFSRTFFERSQQCTACGACCRSNYQQTWYWFDFEPRPDNTVPDTLKLETAGLDYEIPIHSHTSVYGLAKCDYLGTAESPDYCSLHADNSKPLHCLMAPQVGAYVHRGRYYLSKRLPSRNWRHPKCPIDMSQTPLPDESERQTDREILTRFARAFGHLPGCIATQLLEVYEDLYDQKLFYQLSDDRAVLNFEQLLRHYDRF